MLFLNILLKKIQISHHASDLFCRRRGRILPRIQSKNHQIWTKIVFLAIFLPNHVPTYFKVRAAGYGENYPKQEITGIPNIFVLIIEEGCRIVKIAKNPQKNLFFAILTTMHCQCSENLCNLIFCLYSRAHWCTVKRNFKGTVMPDF